MVETRFPKYADAFPQFLMWEMDELMPVALCFVTFLPTRNLLLGLIIGFIIMSIYKRGKEKYPNFFLFHYPYVWGLWKPKLKKTELPKGYVTYYQE